MRGCVAAGGSHFFALFCTCDWHVQRRRRCCRRAAATRAPRCDAMRCDECARPLTRGCEGEVFFSLPLLCSKRITVFHRLGGARGRRLLLFVFARSLFSVLIFSELVLSFCPYIAWFTCLVSWFIKTPKTNGVREDATSRQPHRTSNGPLLRDAAHRPLNLNSAECSSSTRSRVDLLQWHSSSSEKQSRFSKSNTGSPVVRLATQTT